MQVENILKIQTKAPNKYSIITNIANYIKINKQPIFLKLKSIMKFIFSLLTEKKLLNILWLGFTNNNQLIIILTIYKDD